MPLLSNKPKAQHLVQGETAEQLAHDYLIERGLIAVTRNFRCAYGELDLIMQDAQSLVIIEVRYRKNNSYGGALESITYKKQQRIINATLVYLAQSQLNCPVRFDVVAITQTNQIQWLQNAFSND
jgi:putative endonuclease